MITPEYSTLVAYFDLYTKSTDTALRDPIISQRLGSYLTAQLIAANNASYLPHLRSGRLQIPKEYRDREDAIAVVPLSDQEALDADVILEPILEQGGWRRTLTLDAQLVSPISGASMVTAEAIDWINSHRPFESAAAHTKIAARTTARFMIPNTPKDRDGHYYRSPC